MLLLIAAALPCFWYDYRHQAELVMTIIGINMIVAALRLLVWAVASRARSASVWSAWRNIAAPTLRYPALPLSAEPMFHNALFLLQLAVIVGVYRQAAALFRDRRPGAARRRLASFRTTPLLDSLARSRRNRVRTRAARSQSSQNRTLPV
jgi:hypothetical protein